MSKFTKWRSEGFEQIYASTGNFYGGLIVDEDETIIAQNVMPEHVQVIIKAPEMLELLKQFIGSDISAEFYNIHPVDPSRFAYLHTLTYKLIKEIERE